MDYEKLSPPLVAGTIPAFYSNEEGIVLTIPFSMNRAVSPSQVKGYSVKIKTIQSGTPLYSTEILNTFTNEIKCIIPKDKAQNFKTGQFYKIQIAYISIQNVIGYYSTVTVGKYTNKPEITIQNLAADQLNSHLYTYEGVYRQVTSAGENGDITERAYSYQFDLYDSNGLLVASSGLLLHNSDNDNKDTPYESKDEYTFNQDLLVGSSYRVVYTVITNNNLKVSSPRYRVTQKRSIDPELKAKLLVSLNYNNGYIDIALKSVVDLPTIEELTTGFFIVSRACADTNYTVWDEIYRFKLVSQFPTLHLCKDFTIEQGKTYQYSIQQYNSIGLRSNRILSEQIYADFEDAFLFDGKRQLKIKYNPKVSSFKKDLLEQKTDTIGGKHPFIFRNGRVYYSEFPISGLISYQMDEENLFLSEKDYGLTEKTTNLTGENIAAERIFKMKVLEWLTNGEPKVFRSPAEGNFIVRLMNSSLSPDDTLGRMLHTFSSTAYEIADFNHSTLGDMGFISIADMTATSLQWETKNLHNCEPQVNLLTFPARTIRFSDFMPGEVIGIQFKDNDWEQIKIGVTGSYYVDIGLDIVGVQLYERHLGAGSMTYSYEYTKVPKFETVENVNVIEMPGHQFIGEHNILQELLYVQHGNSWIRNPKLELVEIYNIQIEKRPLQKIEHFADDPFLIYDYGSWAEEASEGFKPGYPKRTFNHKYYFDAVQGFDNNGEPKIKYAAYEPYVKINGNLISVDEIEVTDYERPEKIVELYSYNGSLVTIAYQMCDILYNIETEALNVTDENHFLYPLRQARLLYENKLTCLKSEIAKAETPSDATSNTIEMARAEIRQAYNDYIVALVEAQAEDLRRRGVIE